MTNLESFSPQNSREFESVNTIRAKEIAKDGNYQKIESELINENLLVSEIERVRDKYQEVLSTIDFLTEQDLKILTILELYDEELVLHSLETYRIAKEKSERVLDFNIKLIDLFASEGVTPEQFLRACLLHDIGKIEIPNFIINNAIHNQEMELLLRNLVLDEKDAPTLLKLNERTGESLDINNASELSEILNKYNLRSVHFVPVKSILNEEEKEILLSHGFDLNLSLMDIIRTHEEHSQAILKKEGLIVESELAGSHHNYHGKGSPYPLTLDALNISVDMAELIRIADMTEALTASRSYNKNGFSFPRVLRIILEEMRTSSEMAYLWIEDDIKTLESKPSDNLTLEDLQDIEYVKEKLAKIKEDIGQNSFNNLQNAA